MPEIVPETLPLCYRFWPGSAWARRAAERAFTRCYQVPYQSEINRREYYGMLLLEAHGAIERDLGMSGTVHWHRRPSRAVRDQSVQAVEAQK